MWQLEIAISYLGAATDYESESKSAMMILYKTILPFLACALAGNAIAFTADPIVIDDFEGTDYGHWIVSGDAFGTAYCIGSLHTDTGPAFAIDGNAVIEEIVVFPMADIWKKHD